MDTLHVNKVLDKKVFDYTIGSGYGPSNRIKGHVFYYQLPKRSDHIKDERIVGRQSVLFDKH